MFDRILSRPLDTDLKVNINTNTKRQRTYLKIVLPPADFFVFFDILFTIGTYQQ